MTLAHPAGHWYLVQTKPNQEARAEENLSRQGYVCFRPQRERKASAEVARPAANRCSRGTCSSSSMT